MSAEDNGGRRAADDDDGFAVWITSDVDGRPVSILLNATVPEDAGPPLPAGVSHLLAADDALMPGRWGAHTTLCGREVRRPNATAAEHDDDDDHDHLRFDSFHYCPECVAEACRFSADVGDPASAIR